MHKKVLETRLKKKPKTLGREIKHLNKVIYQAARKGVTVEFEPIYVKPGKYTEDIKLAFGVDLQGLKMTQPVDHI